LAWPAYTTYEGGTDSVPERGHKSQTPGNYPKEIIRNSEQGGSLESSMENCIMRLHAAVGNPVARLHSAVGTPVAKLHAAVGTTVAKLHAAVGTTVAKFNAAVGTTVAASRSTTPCSVVRGMCRHTWRSVRWVPERREADTNRPRHTLHMYTSQKKQSHTLTCLCALDKSAVSKL